MKKLLIISFTSMICLASLAAETRNPLMASPTLVWAGLDYSLAHLIGGNHAEYDFLVPDTLFPTMPERWNQLFLDERIERVANALRKQVSVDIAGVTERNKTATAAQIILKPGPEDVLGKSHITQQQIADEVRSLKMKNTSGLGLVFIVDRLVTRNRRSANTTHTESRAEAGQPLASSAAGGAVYVFFFNVATRDVISAKRETHSVNSGSSFRNFWFGPIKDTDENLRKYR